MDGEKFVIHKARMKQGLVLKMEWDRFTCFTKDGEIVFQEDRSYMNTTRKIPWKDILTDWEKKPRSVRYSRFFNYLPEKIQRYLTIHSADTKERVKGIQRLLEKYSFEDIDSVLATEDRYERAPHELGYILGARETTYPEKLNDRHTPAILLDYETNLYTYDQRLCPSLEGSVSS